MKRSTKLGFRIHDILHQAITELAESGVSDATILAVASHLATDDAALLACAHGGETLGTGQARERAHEFAQAANDQAAKTVQ